MNIFWYTFQVYKIIESNISSDMNKPCWKLAKACPQSQKLFCFGENNLLVNKECLITWEAIVTQALRLSCWQYTEEGFWSFMDKDFHGSDIIYVHVMSFMISCESHDSKC